MSFLCFINKQKKGCENGLNPIINKIPIFDATNGIEVTFKIDTQISTFDIEIYNETNTKSVYKESFTDVQKNKFIIPANALDNNKVYVLYLSVTEANETNGWYRIFVSDPQLIRCVPTPSFKLNIDSETEYILKSSYIDVGVVYKNDSSDIYKEKLNEYYVTATDTDGNEVYRSDIIYNINNTVEIPSLVNGKKYTVHAYGTTVGGMKLETSVNIYVNYTECTDSSLLSAENDRKNACVRLKSKISGVIYDIDKEPSYLESYLDFGVNLKDNTLTYKRLNLSGDFCLFTKFIPVKPNVCFLKVGNNIRLNYRVNNQNKPYFEVITKNKSVIINKEYSGNEFNLDSNYYVIRLARENNQIIVQIYSS